MRRTTAVLATVMASGLAMAGLVESAMAAETAKAAPASPAAPTPSAPLMVKGTIDSYAAPVLTVKTAKGESTAITLAPQARVVAAEKTDLSKLKTGDFIASTSSAGKDGRLLAEELRVFPEPLRGLGEGQYPYENGSKSLTNGTITAITAARKGGGILKLSFHGSTPGPNGLCSGHAPSPGQGPCMGDTEIVVAAKTTLSDWILGEPAWLEPGKAVSLFAITGTDGKLTTYGVVVEHNGTQP